MAAAKPQLTRAAALATITVAISALSTACGDADSPATPAPPAADQRAVPADAARFVHQTFHRLPEFCRRGRTDSGRLDATTARFTELYRRYPADRYRMKIDDESGTMLSAILVLRDELSSCSPRHAARIDPILPPQVRRTLRPLPSASARTRISPRHSARDHARMRGRTRRSRRGSQTRDV